MDNGGIAPAINNPDRLSQLDDDWYRQTINGGRPAKGMPTWGTVLSSDQIEDLIALIDAWRKGEAVATTTTVADLLDQTLFALSQKDDKDALFYLERAKPLAFGPGKAQLDPIVVTIQSGDLTKALNDLGEFRKQWPLGDAAKGATVFKDACSGLSRYRGAGRCRTAVEAQCVHPIKHQCRCDELDLDRPYQHGDARLGRTSHRRTDRGRHRLPAYVATTVTGDQQSNLSWL